MTRARPLVAASATPLILAILAGADTYGYAILKRFGELSVGRLQWTNGMLYPVLHRLERHGHIEGRWGASESGRRRKYYRITEQGLAAVTYSGTCQEWLIHGVSVWRILPTIWVHRWSVA